MTDITNLDKQVGIRRHFGFIRSANSLAYPSFCDVGKLHTLGNCDTQSDDIWKTFGLAQT